MSKKKNKKKPEKQKITYIDDNSTIVDMSGTKNQPKRSKSTFKEKARTYFSTVKKMILPMLATLLAFTVVYIILMFAAGKF